MRTKLTPAQVLAIRQRYAQRGRTHCTQASLAAEYSVTVLTVNMIVNRKTWRNLK